VLCLPAWAKPRHSCKNIHAKAFHDPSRPLGQGS
jgi:hypothetical protein